MVGNLTMGCGSRHCMLEERGKSKKRVEANLTMARGTFRNRSILVIFSLGKILLCYVLKAHGPSVDRNKPEALCGSSQSAPMEMGFADYPCENAENPGAEQTRSANNVSAIAERWFFYHSVYLVGIQL